jgi:transcription initiation factor TFIIB
MDKCPACGGPLVNDRERGEVVCAQCGLVVAESAVDVGPEWRAFEKEKRARAAPLRLGVKTDMAAKAEHGAQWLRLSKLHRDTLHGYERRLAKIGAELNRIRKCVGLPQRVVEEAEALLRRYFDAVGGLPPEAAAAAVLWVSLKASGEPRPLKDFLKCSNADEGQVRKAAWRLKEAMKLEKRPSIEDYVGALAARVGLSASTVKAAVDILERNRKLLVGKNPWIWAAAALWLESSMSLKRLAEAAGVTPAGVRNAAKRLR